MDTANGVVPNSGQGAVGHSMSYAYIQGDEVAALDFFEKRLQQTLSPEEREQLTELVTKLRTALEAQTGRKIRVNQTAGGLSNAAY
jgi:hypothetical protein